MNLIYNNVFVGDDGSPSPLDIRIEGCTGPPCNIKRGSLVIIEIDFQTSKKIREYLFLINSIYTASSNNLIWFLIFFYFVYQLDSAGSSIKIEMQIQALFQTIPVPVPPELSNVCNNLLVGGCPYQNNQLLTHRGSIPVPTNVPTGLVVTVIASYVGPSGTLACAKVQGYAS